MNKYLETLTGIGRTGAVVAGAGIGAAKVIDSLSAVAERATEQIRMVRCRDISAYRWSHRRSHVL